MFCLNNLSLLSQHISCHSDTSATVKCFKLSAFLCSQRQCVDREDCRVAKIFVGAKFKFDSESDP